MIRDKNKIQQSAYVERHEGLWAFRPAETHDNRVGTHEGRGQFVLPDDTNATTQQLDLFGSTADPAITSVPRAFRQLS